MRAMVRTIAAPRMHRARRGRMNGWIVLVAHLARNPAPQNDLRLFQLSIGNVGLSCLVLFGSELLPRLPQD
jgi:hypothetical protein